MSKLLYCLHDIALFFLSLFLKVIYPISNITNNSIKAKKTKRIIIIANGPSLKKDIKKLYKKKLIDYYALNYFALSKEFTKIKPNFYFLADPVFWRKDVNINFKKDNLSLFNNLKKVNWKMELICPEDGFQLISNRLKINRNINIAAVKSNPRPLNFKLEKFQVFSILHGLSAPIIISVLILALWHAIKRKVRRIDIYGADFSGFKNITVDQDSNEVYSSSRHFYKNTKAQSNAHFKYPGQIKRKIHERLYYVSISFFQIYILSLVAKKIGIKLLNFSRTSYLDSLDRPKLSQK
jgi:hypothetical protein